ncbi:MAG: YceI family protein [Myxococcota bacterium]
MRFDAGSATCHVFTFKEGLLSRVAHDLKLRAERFSLVVEGEEIAVEVEAGSLKVVCARKGGVDQPGALGRLERMQIERNVRNDVLHVDRHPIVRFDGRITEREDARGRAEGTLTLHGATKPLAVVAEHRAGSWRVETELHQPDYGITPYTAMLGALKIQPRVRVAFHWPAA